jgi:hypothetical protein
MTSATTSTTADARCRASTADGKVSDPPKCSQAQINWAIASRPSDTRDQRPGEHAARTM